VTTLLSTPETTVSLSETDRRFDEIAANEFLRAARGRLLAVDTETNGRDIRDGRGYAMGLSIAYKDDDGQYHKWYFPFRHMHGYNLRKHTLRVAKEVIETAPGLIFHNAKFDIVSLATLGINVPSGRWFCTMIAAHLINENYPYSKSLEWCCRAYLGAEWHKEISPELKAYQEMKLPGDANGWELIPSELMWDYGAHDAEITFRLRDRLLPLFLAEDLHNFWPHKARLIEVVIEMEKRGIGVDEDLCKNMVSAADQAIQDYEEMLGDYKPTSQKQMKELLIDKMGLPVVKWTKGKVPQPSFDKEAMGVYEEIMERLNSPYAEYILAHRGWTKARAAYYQAYLDHRSPDGRLRPSYRHHKDSEEGGTVTGRLSCANPNLQQIPRRTDKPWNGNVKAAFRPTPGYSLWEADYSQLELRLGTAYANVQSLKEVFLDGRDIFTEMAGLLGWPRQNTKTFVYSTQYGAGATRISNVFGVSRDAAQGLIEQYYSMYPGFRAVSQNAAAKALANRKLRLWSGRYRHFQKPSDEAHKAFNSLIQGGAADIVERVMVALFERVDQVSNGEVRMLLQVHDSVVFEIKNGTEEKWVPKIIEVMEDVNNICTNFDVRFAVEMKRFGLAA
jgi:DNA polymerase-1